MTCLTVVDFRSKFLIVGTIDVRREALKGLFPLSRHVGSVSRGDQTVERIWIFHRSFFFSCFFFFYFVPYHREEAYNATREFSSCASDQNSRYRLGRNVSTSHLSDGRIAGTDLGPVDASDM